MDSVSQLLLGAAVGEAVAGRKAGNKAVAWGAVAGSIPDLDVLAQYFIAPIDALIFHRGMTHSIIFALALAPILGSLATKIHRKCPATFKDWTLLLFLALVTHPLLDCFTTWGTALFWPFSDYRVAFKSIFVIDPLYTVPLLVCIVWLICLPRHSGRRRMLVRAGLLISTSYLVFTLLIKQQAARVFEMSFAQQQIEVLRYDTKPAPFTTILWACTAETEEGYYIGYYSFFDEDKQIVFDFFPRGSGLIAPYKGDETVAKLLKMTQGWHTAEPADQGIIFNDLRFGQTAGWETGSGKFAFSYHIYEQEGEVKVEEVERDFKEARSMLRPLLERIMGIKSRR